MLKGYHNIFNAELAGMMKYRALMIERFEGGGGLNPFTTAHQRNTKTAEQLKAIAKKNLDKYIQKQTNALITKLNTVFECNETIPDIIVVEYIKSRVYNYNVKAYFGHYQSSLANGCGYDKTNAAIREVLNYCTPLLKKLYDTKELTKVDGLPSLYDRSSENVLRELNMSLIPTTETKLTKVFKLVTNV